jgi:hypothetical protein
MKIGISVYFDGFVLVLVGLFALWIGANWTADVGCCGGGSGGWLFGVIEGIDETAGGGSGSGYVAYDKKDPMILAQQNAGNIEVLRGRIDGLDGLSTQVSSIKQSVDALQTQVDGLVQQQADYAAEIAGGTTPATITGLDSADSADGMIVSAENEDEQDF